MTLADRHTWNRILDCCREDTGIAATVEPRLVRPMRHYKTWIVFVEFRTDSRPHRYVVKLPQSETLRGTWDPRAEYEAFATLSRYSKGSLAWHVPEAVGYDVDPPFLITRFTSAKRPPKSPIKCKTPQLMTWSK